MGFNVDTYIKQQVKGGVVLDVRGNIDSDVINKILDKVEDRMISSDEPPNFEKRFIMSWLRACRIFITMSMRFRKIFMIRMRRFGCVLIQKLERCYRIVTGNFFKLSIYLSWKRDYKE